MSLFFKEESFGSDYDPPSRGPQILLFVSSLKKGNFKYEGSRWKLPVLPVLLMRMQFLLRGDSFEPFMISGGHPFKRKISSKPAIFLDHDRSQGSVQQSNIRERSFRMMDVFVMSSMCDPKCTNKFCELTFCGN